MIARIYIEGQIGSSHNEDGSIDVKGVELQDVVSMVRKNQDSETIHCHITSPGGSVDEGRKIARYIASLPNIYTVADVQCASIATEIHLAVPIERRKATAGVDYMIHQPMFSLQRGVALNKDELALMSSEIGKTQGEMVNMYAKATGLDKVSLEALMEKETALNDEQLKEFGFVSEILAPSMQAVALIQPKNTNQNQDIMSKLTDEIKALRLQVASIVAGQEIKPEKVNLDLTTADGNLIIVVTEADAPAVGDGVMYEDGSNAEDGTYETPMGMITIADGVITEIVPVEVDVDVEALKAEMEALKAENEEAKAAVELLKTDVVAMAKLTSTYKPKPVQTAFKKGKEAPSEKDSYNAIKEARKAKQAKK